MPPAPNNTQAPTTDYGTAYASFGNVYDPQVQQVNKLISDLPGQQQQQQTQLDQAKANAFSSNALTANSRGLNFSGYAPMRNNDYSMNTYAPAVDKLKTDFYNQKQSLQDKITSINQERANAANSLVMDTKQAQAQAADRAAKASARAAKAGLPSQNDIAAAISGGLAKVTGRDGYVAPEDYAQAYVDWINSGGSAGSFNSNFGHFKNKSNNYYDYAITQALKRG